MPTVEEIASYSACTSDEVRIAIGATALRFAEQLPAFDDDQPTIDIAALDAELAGVEDRVMVDELLANLSDYERSVIEMRYFDDMLQAPIAERVGATQVQISRVLSRSLTVLREAAS
jgi:RNA polymerase sigma-B factor